MRGSAQSMDFPESQRIIRYKRGMSDLSATTVTRWHRYGKDRLYVKAANERQLGWWDLVTAQPHAEDPSDLATVVAAFQSWSAENETPAAPPETSVAPPLPERPWVDLAANLPGESARERAESELRSAPVRSRVARVLGVHTSERAWRIGAKGEERVAARLEHAVRQDPRWRVLHAIPVGTRGADIDHLVIGPGGVFTINAKHHPGAKIWVGASTFIVNGTKQPYVRNSRFEAARASKLLSAGCGFEVFAEGVVVTVGAVDVVIKSQPIGVAVVTRRKVADWVLHHGQLLTDNEVEQIYAIARRSTTWTGAATVDQRT